MSNNLEYSSLKIDYYEDFEKKESIQLDNNLNYKDDRKNLKLKK